jgi:hypothetical protein
MITPRRSKFETLEKRLALAVSATVTHGDLIVQGSADGPVEIMAVGAGSYQVTDNGAVIADATTLQGVDDDVRIQIDQTAGADNSVTLNLTDQTVDRVYASLGNGDNSLQVIGGNVASFFYRGGAGADTVDLGAVVSGPVIVRLGDGDNSLTVSAGIGRLDVGGGDGDDSVTIEATVAGNVSASLRGGDNAFNLTGTIEKNLKVDARDGLDAVTLAVGSSVEGNVKLFLGDGDNTAELAGAIGGSLRLEGLDGDDALTIAATATIADDLYARLGQGDNTVTHNGSVGGDFSVVSKNANDVVNISETAVIGGETHLGLGEQLDRGGGCQRGRGIGDENTEQQNDARQRLTHLLAGRGLGDLRLNGQHLGFYLRGFGR